MHILCFIYTFEGGNSTTSIKRKLQHSLILCDENGFKFSPSKTMWAWLALKF